MQPASKLLSLTLLVLMGTELTQVGLQTPFARTSRANEPDMHKINRIRVLS